MLSKLANYLRGKGGGEDAPCKLKTDQSQEGILRKTKVDLYYKRDEDFEELLVDARLSFETEAVIFIGTLATPSSKSSDMPACVSVSQVGSEKAVEFRYDRIGKFRQHTPDMFQWCMDSRTVNHEEFGLVFPCEESANEFHGEMFARIYSAVFTQVVAVRCTVDQHERLAGKWSPVEKEAVVQLVQSADGKQAYVLIFKESDFPKDLLAQEEEGDSSGKAASSPSSERKSEDTLEEKDGRDSNQEKSQPAQEALPSRPLPLPVSYFPVSVGEYISTLPEINELQWWGAPMDDHYAQKRLYRICFGGVDETLKQQRRARERFLNKFDLVFADVCANKRLSHEGSEGMLKSVDCFRKTSNASEGQGFEIEADDDDPSEDEDGFPVVARDPSKDVLRSSPSAMVNEFFEPGNAHSVICRVGAGDRRDFQLMRFTEGDEFSVVATIDGEKCRVGNKKIEAKCAMLHNQEKQLVVLDKADREAVVLMDLETEKVVRELDAGGFDISQVIPATLDGKSSPDATFNAFNDRAFFNMDSRLPHVARTHTFTYATKQGFSSGATTTTGGVALASSKSVLRLYDGKYSRPGYLKKAKTQLFGFGDPFVDVAVSRDGDWVLTTCARYLLLFNVKKLSDGDEASAGTADKATGFTASIARYRKKPIVLQLSIEDISKFNLQNCNFSKAEFSQDGRTIVTATNNLVIVWDFDAVKAGDVEAYRICPNSDYLKDVAFCRRGGEDAIVMVYFSTRDRHFASKATGSEAGDPGYCLGRMQIQGLAQKDYATTETDE